MGLSVHIPVLFEEVMDVFALVKGRVFVDGTLGGGGHARELLARGAEKLVGLDWDAAAIARNADWAQKSEHKVDLHQVPYDKVAEVLAGEKVDGILMDLGFSSDQLDDAARGLSYHHDGPLDMRLDSCLRRTAADILNGEREEALADIFYHYGEEPKARVLARAVVKVRKVKPFAVTRDLLRVVEEVYPSRPGLKRAHPAARIFQALRVAVNDELEVLGRALEAASGCLKVGGRLAVITFQPLEDRMVKAAFRKLCVDELDGVGRVTAKAPFRALKKVVPTEEEVERNPRARSAILRVLERVS
jgi:16S rRNA (cytosine1402-N4)-methyltransferase